MFRYAALPPAIPTVFKRESICSLLLDEMCGYYGMAPKAEYVIVSILCTRTEDPILCSNQGSDVE